MSDVPKTDAKDMSEPAVVAWRAALGQSTSAQLRETQAALAASQADLTRMEAELHDALRRAADLEQVRDELRIARFRNEGDLADIQDLTSERDGLAVHNAELKAEVLQAATDRVTAAEREQVLRQELTSAMRQLAGVEHDLEHDTGACFLCGLPIPGRVRELRRRGLRGLLGP